MYDSDMCWQFAMDLIGNNAEISQIFVKQYGVHIG